MSKREGEREREKGRERERVTLHSLSNTVLIIYFCRRRRRRREAGGWEEGSELQLLGNVCSCACVYVHTGVCVLVCLWRGGSRATDVFAHNAWIRPCCCKQDVWGTKHHFWKMFTLLSNPLPGAPWHLAFLLLPFSHFHSILFASQSVLGGLRAGTVA